MTSKITLPRNSVWEEYHRYQIHSDIPGRVKYSELVAELTELANRHAQQISLRPLAKSVEGRDIYRVDVGRGSTRVALWSQMHGDEPTHTVVLLELLRALLAPSPGDWAKTILDRCALTMVPMLNPDGAARWTRFNAQTIDINRDARRLATPEGRALHQLVFDEPFEFAFNLHNQSRYSTVDGKHLAAVSLLVPPLDEQDTETAWVRRAKSLAGQFERAVRPYCQALISRYDAGYMPRCFGEWVQAQEISTLLVEAGGSPDPDPSWLTRVHFTGLVAALESIARQQSNEEDVSRYQALPCSSPDRSFDLLIRGVKLPSSAGFDCIDVGVNGEAREGRAHATIQDLGDLQDHSGLSEYDGGQTVCRPGRVYWLPHLRPSALDGHLQFDELIAQGVTTVLGVVPLDQAAELTALADIDHGKSFPLNVAFLGSLPPTRDAARHRAFVAEGAAAGACGIILHQLDPSTESFARALRLPCVKLPFDETHVVRQPDILTRLFPTRGRVERLMVADLALFEEASAGEEGSSALGQRLRCLWINGVDVLIDGKALNAMAGQLIKRA